MPSTASPSMLLIRPPSADRFASPPATLTGLTAFVSAIEVFADSGSTVSGGSDEPADTVMNTIVKAAADQGTAHCVWTHAFHPPALMALMDLMRNRPVNLKLSLACRLDDATDVRLSVPPGMEALVQVLWRVTDRMPALGFFKAFSRAGIWNHLELVGQAATTANRDTVARQPDIIHSWQAATGRGCDTSADDGYRGLPVLPGQPLWRSVDDPTHRFMLIDRFGKDWLMRSRVDGDRIITLGGNLTYHFCPPDRLPEGYLDDICAMVAAGGTVATTYVRANLEHAYLIGYVQENGIIVGNSSLKHPRPQYIESVRLQSGLDLTGYVERGYTSVRPEYRGLGIGTRLLEGLTDRAGDRKIFSVIAEDNTATQIIARRNRTRQVASYYSEKAGKTVGIWMPEWMIEDHGNR